MGKQWRQMGTRKGEWNPPPFILHVFASSPLICLHVECRELLVRNVPWKLMNGLEWLASIVQEVPNNQPRTVSSSQYVGCELLE